MDLHYIKPTQLEDCPSVGCLYDARRLKALAWKGVKRLRAHIRQTPFRNGGLRLELMRAEENHRETLRMERGALQAIEDRANELGLTTRKAV